MNASSLCEVVKWDPINPRSGGMVHLAGIPGNGEIEVMGWRHLHLKPTAFSTKLHFVLQCCAQKIVEFDLV